MPLLALYIACFASAIILLIVAISMIALQMNRQQKSCVALKKGTADTLSTMQEAHEATLVSLQAISNLLHYLVDADTEHAGAQAKMYDKLTRMECQMRDIQEVVDELHVESLKQSQDKAD